MPPNAGTNRYAETRDRFGPSILQHLNLHALSLSQSNKFDVSLALIIQLLWSQFD